MNNNNHKSCCKLTIIVLMVRAAMNQEASCNCNGHCNNELENECMQMDPWGKKPEYMAKDQGSLWVEMENYKSITPAKKGFQQKHRPEGFLLQSSLGWTTRDQTHLRRANIRCPTVSADVWMLQDEDGGSGHLQVGRTQQNCPRKLVMLQLDRPPLWEVRAGFDSYAKQTPNVEIP